MTLSSEALTSILIQATSPDPSIRDRAFTTLQELQKQMEPAFFNKLFDLLASRDRNTHILAYSYLLNQVVLKLRRFSENFIKSLDRVYFFFFEIGREQYTFGRNSFELQEENVLNLLVQIYSKPLEAKSRKDFFRQKVPLFCTDQFQYKTYLKKIISKLVQTLSLSEKKQNFSLHSVFLPVISHLWTAGGLFNYEVAIDLSYFSPLFPQELWKNFVVMLNEPNAPEALVFKILKRSFSALDIEHHTPNIECCFELYQSLKRLSVRINLSRITEEDLLTLLILLYHCLRILLAKERLPSMQIPFLNEILSIREYSTMINWLISITQDSTEEDEEKKLISQRAIDIITIYSEKMEENELAHYFREVYQNVSSQNQEKFLFLLSGAPRRVHEICNSDLILQKIIKNPKMCLTSKSNSYFLFLERCISNEYYMDNSFVSEIFNFVQECLTILEGSLKKVSSKLEEQQLTIKISILLSAFLLSSKYPRNPQNEQSFIDFACLNTFKYLTGAEFGLPDLAHQKLYQSINILLSMGIPVYNQTFCDYAIHIYYDLYLTAGVLTPEKQRTSSKVRQQMLMIIKNTLTPQSLKNDDLLNRLLSILKTFNGNDLVISKTILFLLGRYLQLLNVMIIELELYQMMNYLDADKEYINFQLRNSFNEIMFSQKFHQFLEVITSNLEYDISSTIDLFLEEFLEALKVLIEMSIHRYCFQFVQEIAYQLIVYLNEEASSLQKLYELSRRKQIKISFSILQLKRLPIYLDCLLEILYLNPKWRDISHSSQIKDLIIKTATFQKCKERVDLFVAGDITKMMEQISVQENEKKNPINRWDKVYFDILSGSGVGEFCEVWINMLKESSL